MQSFYGWCKGSQLFSFFRICKPVSIRKCLTRAGILWPPAFWKAHFLEKQVVGLRSYGIKSKDDVSHCSSGSVQAFLLFFWFSFECHPVTSQLCPCTDGMLFGGSRELASHHCAVSAFLFPCIFNARCVCISTKWTSPLVYWSLLLLFF